MVHILPARFGVPIPALHFTPSSPSLSDSSGPSTQTFLDNCTLSHIIPILQQKGTDHWFSNEVDEFVPPELSVFILWYAEMMQLIGTLGLSLGDGTWRKSFDIMDVWFDIGTLWAHLLV